VDCFHAGGCRAGLFGGEQFERVQCDRHIAGKNLEELQVAFRERAWLGAFDVQRAGHAVVQHDGHGQRTAGTGCTFEIERIFARIFAQIAFTGCGDKASDTVAGGFGK
jgi:hypothetical protein